VRRAGAAHVFGVGVQALVQGGLLVDLQHEVHAALQVQAQHHRATARLASQSGTVEARFRATV
jgi:hypothetical protein